MQKREEKKKKNKISGEKAKSNVRMERSRPRWSIQAPFFSINERYLKMGDGFLFFTHKVSS